MTNIEQYLTTTGYYDTTKIREDAGMNSRAALFADIFGGDDSDGGQPTAKLAPAWQALLDEAERRNNERYAAETQAEDDQARAILTQTTISQADWKWLAQHDYAQFNADEASTDGALWHTSYTLTRKGRAL